MAEAPSTMEDPSVPPTISLADIDPANVITKEDIERKPWKYVGYRGYTNIIASEDDFFILRRFNSLNVRIALFLQDEIVVLESKLAELDERTSRKSSEDIHNGSFRQDQNDRTTVLNEIRKAILKYNEFILQQAEMKKFQTPRGQDIRSLCNWHYNHDDGAILLDERKYLEHTGDLFSVIQKDKAPLRKLIDRSRLLRTLCIWRLNNQSTPNDEVGIVSYYSDERINTFASAVIVSLGAILLLVPLWILYALNNSALKLAVITAFVASFLIILSFAMVAKPFEALGVTAAYAAVLTVFLQFGGGT
ncbi:hypothetical protein O1611_g7303 [Lasiodiplodia mahajangana]|uniref:Uncharacterized protein n=1 Tax=Lasiodiplodia mahajangana TaxID=1108764 RepID=A0ACC2JFS7_9PEZI|nr:hypothetical protein O1611_g7303 [Lasiodiplodia mahajangana]